MECLPLKDDAAASGIFEPADWQNKTVDLNIVAAKELLDVFIEPRGFDHVSAVREIAPRESAIFKPGSGLLVPKSFLAQSGENSVEPCSGEIAGRGSSFQHALSRL